jgi:dipeptidyl aminopeptidase/acylaminoacyl peptidase
MMKKAYFLTLFILVGSMAYAQPGSDIYLFSFSIDEDQFSLSNARNITNSPGYDNQPFFLEDGESLLYSSDDGFGQTDIYRYNIKSRSERRLTFTPGSEYSPTITPDGKFFSCIILEKNGDQYLWKYPLQGAVPQKVSSVSPVGYHSWVSDDEICVFVVGEPNTLKLVELGTDNTSQIANSPGTTLAMIPGKDHLMSYVDLSSDNSWEIKSLDTSSKESTDIIKSLKKSQYYAWTPSGILILGDGKRLYKFDPDKDKDWVELANLTDYGIKDFSRIAVSPQGNFLAVVVGE